MTTLTILGTGTCEIQPNRITSSAIIETERARILFDIGRGVCNRLVELGIQPNDITDIIISHFHPDHCSDLVPFLQDAAWSRKAPRVGNDLTIHGPVESDLPGLNKYIELLNQTYPFPSFKADKYNLTLNEYSESRQQIGGLDLEFVSLPPHGNHGIRFVAGGKTIALTGDSGFHPAEVEFLKGVDLAVIDAGHLKVEEIIDLCVQAQPKKVVCSHIYEELKESELASQAKAAGFMGEIIVGADRMQFSLKE